MTRRYSRECTVGLHEIGPGGTIKIPSLFNNLQCVTGDHSRSIGYGTMDMLNDGFTWVISRYRLSIASLPKLFEKYTVTTWRSGESGKYAIREFLVTAGNGDVLTRGTSSWILLDFRKMEKVRPSDMYPGYPVDPARAMDDEFGSMPVIETSQHEKDFAVRRNDLDINNHVNNAFYIAWILESGEDMNIGMKPVDIAINFRGEARFGETVLSRAVRDNVSGRLVHSLVVKESGKELTRGVTEWK